MKLTLISGLLALGFSASAQRASITKDTAFYNNAKYKVGDTVTVAYGSKIDKGFAFIGIGGNLTGVTDLDKEWSKNAAIIDKVYKKGSTVILRAKLTDKSVNMMGGNKLFIDLEGAVDNKELYEKH